MSPQRCFLAEDAGATRALGATLAALAPAGLLLRLEGPLGAGKTTFCQGFGRGLGIAEPLLSPSFTLIREYPLPAGPAAGPASPERLVHADLYRLSAPAEAIDLGLDDYLDGEDLLLVEWPQRGGDALPRRGLAVRLERAGRRDGPEASEADPRPDPARRVEDSDSLAASDSLADSDVDSDTDADEEPGAERRHICLIALDGEAAALLEDLQASAPGLQEIESCGAVELERASPARASLPSDEDAHERAR